MLPDLEAWKLMAAGATGVYIFDDTAGKAYWPDDFVELLGEAIHTGFRKGTDCPQAHPIWKLIQEMPADDWAGVLYFVAHCFQGMGIVKEGT